MGKVVILGGANIDVIGQSRAPLLEYDSNPGKIKISYGGVGRNIGENCCRMGCNVTFATVFGNDAFAEQLIKSCKSVGMKLEASRVSKKCSSSIYLAVLDHDQDMKVAISDMNLLQEVDEAMVRQVIELCEVDDILVLDTNLEQETIEMACAMAKCPIYMDPISCAKAVKVKNCLGKIHTFKPNRYEAQLLCGFEIDKEEDKIRAIQWFLDQGVKEIVISLSSQGTLIGNEKGIYQIIPKPIIPLNATGGGDSFLAGLIAFRDLDFFERYAMATALAIKTILSEDTVNQTMNREKCMEFRKTLNIKERTLCLFESVMK